MANANSTWLAERIKTDVLGMTGLKIALYTDNVNANGTGTEVVGGSYARQSITLEADGSGAVRNAALIEFTAMPAATVKSAGIWDTSGNLVIYGNLDSNKAVVAGDPLKFIANAISMSWLI